MRSKRHVLLTIKELVDQDEVVLDGFFIQLIKVRLGDAHEAVQELEDESCVGVASVGGTKSDTPSSMRGYRNRLTW